MNKADLLKHTLEELAKTLGESTGKMNDLVREKMGEELPHRSKMEQIKIKNKLNLIEQKRNESMFAFVGASTRAKEIIKFLSEEDNKKKEQWSSISVMGGNTEDKPMEPLKVEQDKAVSGKPRDGKELDSWIKQGKAPNDTGPVYSQKSFEDEKITKDGNLIHIDTDKPVPQLYVGSVQHLNGAPDEWIGKPIKFLGRRIWAFAGRGYGHEVEVGGEYGILSLNGVTDKPTK
jgi:hypothetical protein